MMHRVLRIVCVAAVTGAGLSLSGLSGSTPAFGKPLPRNIIECTSMQSETNSFTAPVLLSGCSRPQSGGSGVTSVVGPGPYPIDWANKKHTDFSSKSMTFPVSRCQAPQFEFDFVGTITKVAGPWTKQYLGEDITFDVCLTDQFGIAGLVPGTVFAIGALAP